MARPARGGALPTQRAQKMANRAKDEEEGASLIAPEFTPRESDMRWGFVRKVYAILFSQLALTGVVSTWVVLDEAPRRALTQNPVLFWLMLLSPLLLMIPLFMMRQRHPHNLILLGVWTLAQSLSIGVICSAYPLPVLAEAIVLTAAVCGGLTSYTFYAIRKGHDFSYLGQILFGGLLALLLWGFVQMFFPVSSAVHAVFALLGAGLFSAYLVYDTGELSKRFDIDEYVWAAIMLYLDVVNIFIRLLEVLDWAQRS